MASRSIRGVRGHITGGWLEGTNMLLEGSLLICISLHSTFISRPLLRTTLWFTILESASVQYGNSVKNNVLARIIAGNTRVVPKLMPPIYFHGNYTRYKEHNNTI